MRSEKPEQSLESQLKMARPKRHEVKRVPLTPEEKAFLGEIMDKAVAAEKAGDLAEALGYYTDYRNELFRIKEKREEEEKGKQWNRDDVIEWVETYIVNLRPEDAPDWVDDNFEFDELPKIKIKSGLSLTSSRLDTMPNNFHVQGSLRIDEAIIQEMPEALNVEENLDISLGKINSLPVQLYVGNDLILINVEIENNHIPEDIYVGGDVFINKSNKKIIEQLYKLKEQGKIVGEVTEEE